MIRYNDRCRKSSRWVWAVRWDLIHVELWGEPVITTNSNLSQLFLSFEEKSVFTEECFQKAQKKIRGKWVNLQLLFNEAILYFIMSWIYISQLPESCILSFLLLPYSIFNLWITYFETIIWESVSQWCMCLHEHIYVHIACTVLQRSDENHRYSKKCCNFVQQDGKKRMPQCELCRWLLNHCSILALTKAMFSSVSGITVFRREQRVVQIWQTIACCWATFLLACLCRDTQIKDNLISLGDKFDTAINMCAQDTAIIQAIYLML